MTTTTPPRLTIEGHGLQREGKPYSLSTDCTLCHHLTMGFDALGTWNDGMGLAFVSGREGHGLCACGWTTSHTLSQNERKQEHRWHKEEVWEREVDD